MIRKIEALSVYKSQQGRYYITEEFVRSLAHVRGVSVRKHYAEVFDIVRMIIE